MKDVSIIIPAYKPDEKLLSTLRAVVEIGFTDLLVVDDGSGEEFSSIFEQAAAMPEVTLLRHPVNKGKGAALKTALTFFKNYRAGYVGAVAADADGQHLAEDVLAVAQKLKQTGHFTLGCRDFSKADVPPRSRFGNRITIGTFRLFFGMKISDTQTGLRGFPRGEVQTFLNVPGNRYEYETNMLFEVSRNRLPFEEVLIHTVYIEENASSHFRPVLDSMRIYGLILKYLLSSVAAAAVDALAFFLFKFFAFLEVLPVPLTFSAAFLARALSSLVNFMINARVVFGDKVSVRSLVRYYTLVVIQICISALCVFGIEHLLVIRSALLSTLIKVVVDTVLFFFSFRIQHKWVFNNET